MAPPVIERYVALAVRELERDGLMLETDPKLPSLVALVAGGPVQGSWWGHPLGHTIFAVGAALYEHPDVLLAKLVSSKATWLHRRLWPATLAVALSGEPWQLDGLSEQARALWKRVRAEGELAASGDPARELETRLLVRGAKVHTESGRHERVLERWERWAERVGASRGTVAAEEGRAEIELTLSDLNRIHEGAGKLPWQKGVRRRTRPTSR
jgi:hypothetical protein